MAWSFRKRFKVADKVDVSLSEAWTKTSFGMDCTSLSLGSEGTYKHSDTPGTGVYDWHKPLIADAPEKKHAGLSIDDIGCLILVGLFILCIPGLIYLGVTNTEAKNVPAVLIISAICSAVLFGIYCWISHIKAEKAKSKEDDNSIDFDYDAETNLISAALNNDSGEGIRTEILKAYKECLPVSLQIVEKEAVIEVLKAKDERKYSDVIKENKILMEALQKELSGKRFDASAYANEVENKLYEALCDEFENLISTGSNLYDANGNRVSVGLGTFDFIRTPFYCPVLSTADGCKIYFYPSFVIIAKSTVDFSVVKYPEVNFGSFEQTVWDRDKQSYHSVLEKHYLYTNKDGSVDLRYKDNPVSYKVICGRLTVAENKKYGLKSDNYERLLIISTLFNELHNARNLPSNVTYEEYDSGKACKTNGIREITLPTDADPFLKEVALLCVNKQEANVLLLQKHFSVGFNRAHRILKQLEELTIISSELDGERTVYCKSEEDLDFIFDALKDRTEVEDRKKESSKQVVDEIVQKHKQMENGLSGIEELKELIGLYSVKTEITALSNFVKLNQEKIKRGLPAMSVSYHCVFTGNPGTGKTTVARIVAKIYKELGVLKSGHLVEVDRSGLVAEYVGQTAVKTNKVIDSALDGVLFIDEAYTLANCGGVDYGHEAIATLLKRMEDDRDRLVVIVAGYTNEMKTFIDANPGLQSRFTRYIDFPDYTDVDLYDIFLSYASKNRYIISQDASNALRMLFYNVTKNKGSNFGNGRYVRNVFEKTLQNQANRLAAMSEWSDEMLTKIDKEDIPSE